MLTEIALNGQVNALKQLIEVGANLQLQNAEQGILRDMPPFPEN